MTSVLKAQKANALKASANGKGKRKADDIDVEEHTDAPAPKRTRNKQRVLLLSSRGITHRMRHLMNDIEALLPHVKKGQRLVCLQMSPVLNMVLRFEAGFEEPPPSATRASRPQQLQQRHLLRSKKT